MDATPSTRSHHREPWNKGTLIGQKAPFKPKDISALRVRLQQWHRSRELALLNLGIDSKPRACDLVSLKVRDVTHGERVASRAIVQQNKTGRPVQFEIVSVDPNLLFFSRFERGLTTAFVHSRTSTSMGVGRDSSLWRALVPPPSSSLALGRNSRTSSR